MEPLDTDAVNLAKAIRKVESNDNFQAKGKSGEYGAYQFTEPTWKKYASETLGNPNAELTPENQNKVAYTKIKQWKDQGYKPDQIASMWNSGKPEYQGKVGVNSHGVSYDVPGYVNKVYGAYQETKGIKNQESSKVPPIEIADTNLSSKGEGTTLAGKVIRGILKPVATLAARPYQLGMAIGGSTPEEQTIHSKYLGDITAASTGKDLLKDVGRGLETVSLGIGGGAASNVIKGAGKQGLLRLAGTGAKEGAKTGIIEGIGSGLEKGKKAGGVVKSGLTGGLLGGITGGVLGGVTSFARNGILNKSENYLDAITPNTKDLTPTEYEQFLRKGRINPASEFGADKYILSDSEKAAAEKFKDLLTSKNPVQNSINLMSKIAEKDKDVGSFLRKNNGIFNTGELKNHLTKNLEDITDLTVDEGRLGKAKESLVNSFLTGLKKNDMESLWTARKEFDKSIEKAFSGSPTVQKEVKIALRNAVQDFISDRTPEGVYKATMKDMSDLFRLQDNVARKATKGRGTNEIVSWLRKHPNISQILGWATATGLGGGLIGTMVGKSLKD